MKTLARLSIMFLISIPNNLYTQKYNSAQVTDFFHFTRTIYSPELQDYTDYFTNHPIWAEHLISFTDSLIRRKFNVKDVKFDMQKVEFRQVHAYAYGSNLFPLPFERFNNISRSTGELYIAILSTMANAGYSESNGIGKENLGLLLKILVEDNNGKKIYSNKIKIPFYLQPADYLYQSGIRHEDFKLIYEQAIREAFKGGKKIKSRPLNYNPLHFYDDLISQCNYYFLKETDQYRGGNGDYEIFKVEKSKKGSIELSGGEIHKEFTEEFLNLDLTDRMKQKGKLSNSMDSIPYYFIGGISINEGYENTIDPSLPVVALFQNDKQVGIFEFSNNCITGKIKDRKLHLKYINNFDLYELYMNDILSGIIQDGKSIKEDKKNRHYYNAYFLKTINQQELAKLFNLFMSYQITLNILLEYQKDKEDE